MNRHLALAALLAAGVAFSGCLAGKSAEEKARQRREELERNYTFQAPDGAYGARCLRTVESDLYEDGLAPLIPRAEETSPEPVIPEDAWRAASLLRLPASPDGQTLIVPFSKCLYGIDLATGNARWRLEMGAGCKTVYPYNGKWIVKTGTDWENCVILDPAKAAILSPSAPAPADLPSPAEIDRNYVKFSLAETGVHRYEFPPDGPTIRCYSKNMAPRLSYDTFGAFDPKTEQTLWVMKFRYGVQAFNRVGDRYAFLTTDSKGQGWVYLFQIAPKPQ